MIQSIRRNLDKKYSFAELEAFARKESDFETIIDVNDHRFLAPTSMIGAIADYCREKNLRVPQNIGQTVQCVYRSLAAFYADSIKGLEVLVGHSYDCLNIVGGGTKDTYLNQLTANACGLPVFAGPSEGTAVGNILSQCLSQGEISSVAEARDIVFQSFEINEYRPES